MTRDEAAVAILERVLAREGGVKDIGDGAGLTRFGQTAFWLRRYGLQPPTTADEAVANYRVWLVASGLIGLCDQADSLADVTIDFAVNAGDAAVFALQQALGVKADGVIGPRTQAAIDACDRRAVAVAVFIARMRYRGEIITGNPQKHAQWAKGWAYRDSAQLRTIVAELM